MGKAATYFDDDAESSAPEYAAAAAAAPAKSLQSCPTLCDLPHQISGAEFC